MAEIIQVHEQEFSSLCAEITSVTGRLKDATSPEDVSNMAGQLEVLFSDARETLEQIELESHGLGGQREKVRLRLSSYQVELGRQQNQFETCRSEASRRTDRLQLLGGPETGGGAELVREADEIIESSGHKLDEGRRLLAETEEVGGRVLGDLASQRETLQRSRDRLKDVELGLGQSSSILNKMVFRAQQNKALLFIVIVVIFIVFMFGVYHLATS